MVIPLNNTSSDISLTQQVAQAAFNAFKQGIETGDGQPFAALMHEHVIFRTTVPLEQWRGEQHGRLRAGELLFFEYHEMKLRALITQLGGVATYGNTFAFEFHVQAEVRGASYQNWNALFFEVEGNKISRWREYIGDVDLQAMASVQHK